MVKSKVDGVGKNHKYERENKTSLDQCTGRSIRYVETEKQY